MGGCSLFSFSLVHFRVSRVRALYKSKGLKSQMITLDNGSTMHCWVPYEWEDKPKRRSWKRSQGQAQQPRNGERHPRTRQEDLRERAPRSGLWRGRGGRGRQARQQQGSKPLHHRPAVVLIHGFGGNGLMGWENQIAALTKDYRVYIPDLLFFGKSTTRNTQRTEIFQADCIANMLQKLNVQETHVVGTSYGGFVAFWMAYKYPQLCWKVVLCSSGICMNPWTNDELLKQCNLRSIDEILLPTTVDGLKLAFSCLYVRPPALPDFIVQQILDIFYKPEDRHHRLELLHGLVIGSEQCPPLPNLTQEVLIIWGREDHIFELPLATQLQQHFGAGRVPLVIMENTGHMPQIERSKEFNAILMNFLDEAGSSQGSRSR